MNCNFSVIDIVEVWVKDRRENKNQAGLSCMRIICIPFQIGERNNSNMSRIKITLFLRTSHLLLIGPFGVSRSSKMQNNYFSQVNVCNRSIFEGGLLNLQSPFFLREKTAAFSLNCIM